MYTMACNVTKQPTPPAPHHHKIWSTMIHLKALSLVLFDIWKLSLYMRNMNTPRFKSAHLQTLYLHKLRTYLFLALT